MVCLPCRQFKHTHGKPDTHSCLEFPLEKFRPKFHPSIIQTLALFHGMLLVAQINLPAFPALLPAWHSPSINKITSTSPPSSSQCWSENRWLPVDAKGTWRVPSMCRSVLCPPLSLSPSECMHWSISISHGAFSTNPAGSFTSLERRCIRMVSCSWGQCYSSWTGLWIGRY